MASFKPTVITSRGQSLLAKVEAGLVTLTFTNVRTSSTQYPDGTKFETLTAMTNIKQTSLVSGVRFASPASVLVTSSFTNASLSTGYYVYAVGLYATDPDLGEILFSITPATMADYMPADNGVSVSSILVELLITTGNATNVNLQIEPSAFVTIATLEYVLIPETGTITLNNTQSFPFNNSIQSVGLIQTRLSLNYEVFFDVLSTNGCVGNVIISDKLLNGFKIAFDGSATSVTIQYRVSGGMVA